MDIIKKSLTLAMLCSAGVSALPSYACAIAQKEVLESRHQAAVAEAKKEALVLREEADFVFTGRLSSLAFQDETVRSSSGAPQQIRVHRAVFDLVDNIKGTYSTGHALEFTVIRNRVVTSTCGHTDFRASFPKENGAGNVYLVYAGSGKLLRASIVLYDSQPLEGLEEVTFLKYGQ